MSIEWIHNGRMVHEEQGMIEEWRVGIIYTKMCENPKIKH